MQATTRVAFLLVALSTHYRESRAGNVADTIRGLVPTATAMKRKDFEKFAVKATRPEKVRFKDKPLTLILMTTKPIGGTKQQQEFRTVSLNAPDILVEELTRFERKPEARLPITMIHADRITGITCDVQAGEAKGVISFHVPRGYAGEVQYIARRRDGEWQIEEFQLPAYMIHIGRAEDGRWRETNVEKPAR